MGMGSLQDNPVGVYFAENKQKYSLYTCAKVVAYHFKRRLNQKELEEK